MPPDSGAPTARRFAGYEIVDDLGVHAGVRRYKAIQVTIGRPVLLNVLAPEAAKKPACVASFERQMQVSATLRHENVVAAIDAGEYEGCRYFVTEFVEGRLLHDVLAHSDPGDVRRAVSIALDVARALAHLESHRMVHRDVSPRTITLSDSGPARLVDLRRVKFVTKDAAETWSDTSVNVALYLAPERARGDKSADIRADIYSLGCVLYHLLTGRPPFYGKNVAVVLDMLRKRRPRDPRWLRAEIPKHVADVLDRCLRKMPDERYPTAAALVADLELALAGRAPALPPVAGSAWERPFQSG